MAINRINHQGFGDIRCKSERFGRFFEPMLDPSLSVQNASLKCSRLRTEPLPIKGLVSGVSAQRDVTIVRRRSEMQNRNGIAVIEPKCDCCLKLRQRSLSFCINLKRRWRFWIGTQLLFALITSTMKRWLSATPIKKLLSKSRKLRNPSRLLARNFWNRPSLNKSYATRRSTPSRTQASHLTSSRSSRPEKFVSRFFARSTLSAVSVTVTGILPCDLRPEPFRLPPCRFLGT
jgi:hypothetical protein